MNGYPMMHMTIPEEIAAHFKNYVRSHPELTVEERNMLEEYSEMDSLMQIMGYTFFHEWQDVRNFTVEAWTLNIIEELLSMMEVIDG